MELLGREISRSRRERVPTAILLCDVDHFKNIKIPTAISSAMKYYRKPAGAFFCRYALMITSADTAVKSF